LHAAGAERSPRVSHIESAGKTLSLSNPDGFPAAGGMASFVPLGADPSYESWPT